MLQKLIQRYGRRKYVVVFAILIMGSAILSIPLFPASVINSQVVYITKPRVNTAPSGTPVEFTVSFLPSSLRISDPVATDLQLMVTTPEGVKIVLDEALDFRTPDSFTRTVYYTPTMDGVYTFRAGMLVHSETGGDSTSDPVDPNPPATTTTQYTYTPTGGGGGYYVKSVISVFDLMAGAGETEYYNTRELTITGSSLVTSTPVGGTSVSFPHSLFIILSVCTITIITRRKRHDQN